MASRWQRWTLDWNGGVVFVVLFLIRASLPDVNPEDSDEEIVAYFADGGNRATDIAGIFLIVVAGLFFLWFLGALRTRLREAEGESGHLSTIAFGSGLTFLALLLVAAVTLGTTSVGVEFVDAFRVDPDTVRTITIAGFGFLLTAFMVAAVLVAATSVLALRTAVLPRWLAWAGFLVALALLFSVFFFPIFAFAAWILVVSIVLIVRSPDASRPSPA